MHYWRIRDTTVRHLIQSLSLSSWLCIAVIAAGIFIRFIQLGIVPAGLGWDETAIGYNGWAVLTTRRDEWLNKLPLSFRSFGDYKAPLAIYVNGPFTYFLGPSSLSVRLPFALFSVISIAVWSFLLGRIARTYHLPTRLRLIGTALLAFSPWHFIFSRIAFEAGIASSLLMAGAFFLWPRRGSVRLVYMLVGASCFALSMYAYHSAKIVTPLLFGMTLLLIWIKHFGSMRRIVATLIFWIVCIFPLGIDAAFGKGATRAGDLIVLKTQNTGEMLQMLGSNILSYLNPLYWVLGEGGDSLRHVTGLFGLMLPGTMLLAATACVVSFRNHTYRTLTIFFGVWLLAGMLPGLLTTPAPHANRTLLALPGLIGLASLGMNHLWYSLERKQQWRSFIIGTLCLVQTLFFIGFISDYFNGYKNRSAPQFQDGYVDAIAYASQQLQSNTADHIVISDRYGQTYIYLLYLRSINPIAYQQGALANVGIKSAITTDDLIRPRTVVLFTPGDPLAEYVSSLDPVLIQYPDGSVAFYGIVTGD